MADDANFAPDTPPTDVGLQARVDQLDKQVSDYKLLVAELQTSLRRLSQDADRQRKYAAEPLARDLLLGMDNLHRAAEAAHKAGDTGPLAQGVAATTALFLDILKRHGVTPIEVAPGAPFDAHRHQAVMHQPSPDHPPGAVAAVFQPGFLFHDRVLRPATVAVVSDA